jgi:hypothetical protein
MNWRIVSEDRRQPARFVPHTSLPFVHRVEVIAFDAQIIVRPSRHPLTSDVRLLDYLAALTIDFERDGQRVSAVLIYSEPDPEIDGVYRAIVAQETGFEGIACLDDTARAARLALDVYDHSGSRRALELARRWLTFVAYMQYPDGAFANFIRNESGVRNATGPTSVKGGYWWSSRALWALARAYRITRREEFRERFEACHLDPLADGKINALLALSKLELYAAEPSNRLRKEILAHCELISGSADDPYFLDQPGVERLNLWGYHQLHALASAASVLDAPRLLKLCRHTVRNLIEPDIRAHFWHDYPARSKHGVTAYDVSPMVQGLAAMCRATKAQRYRRLALNAAAWFYGRNDARTPMYDPTTGRCRDGITDGVVSQNYGAESAIEAGFAELERRTLIADA